MSDWVDSIPYPDEHWPQADEAVAKARLIAAAPDLLAAAIAQEELMRTPGDPTENILRVIKMRRAAIAKATGPQEQS